MAADPCVLKGGGGVGGGGGGGGGGAGGAGGGGGAAPPPPPPAGAERAGFAIAIVVRVAAGSVYKSAGGGQRADWIGL
jgi:hypothetical protein